MNHDNQYGEELKGHYQTEPFFFAHEGNQEKTGAKGAQYCPYGVDCIGGPDGSPRPGQGPGVDLAHQGKGGTQAESWEKHEEKEHGRLHQAQKGEMIFEMDYKKKKKDLAVAHDLAYEEGEKGRRHLGQK